MDVQALPERKLLIWKKGSPLLPLPTLTSHQDFAIDQAKEHFQCPESDLVVKDISDCGDSDPLSATWMKLMTRPPEH